MRAGEHSAQQSTSLLDVDSPRWGQGDSPPAQPPSRVRAGRQPSTALEGASVAERATRGVLWSGGASETWRAGGLIRHGARVE